MTDIGPEAVIAFWQDAGPDKWFKKDAEFDRRMTETFKTLHAEAAAGRRSDWAATPTGALALVLLLDQFSRNMYRNTPMAFAQDEQASAIAEEALAAGFDKAVPAGLASFFHMPFMHAERIADQERSVLFFHSQGGKDGLFYARIHRDIVRRFGRFPHRNPILGRHTTPAEQLFLDSGGFAG